MAILLVTSCLLSSPGAAGEQGSAATAVGGHATSLTREEVAALTVEIAPIVEEIRGAKFDHTVPVEVVDDAKARAHFKERMDRYWPDEVMRAQEIL